MRATSPHSVLLTRRRLIPCSRGAAEMYASSLYYPTNTDHSRHSISLQISLHQRHVEHGQVLRPQSKLCIALPSRCTPVTATESSPLPYYLSSEIQVFSGHPGVHGGAEDRGDEPQMV